MPAILAFILLILLVPLLLLINGFTLSILWGWFISPTFGLQPLAIAPAIGVSIVAGWLTYTYVPSNSNKTWEQYGLLLARPLLALLVGYVVKGFM